MINALFWRLAGLSLACSAVLLPLLLASRFIRGRYSARTCYVLWLLLGLRLILPLPIVQAKQAVTVEVPAYEVAWTPQSYADAQLMPAKPQTPVQEDAAGLVPSESVSVRRVSLTVLLPSLWLVGAAGCGLWLAASYVLARRVLLQTVKPGKPEDEALMDTLFKELNCKRRPVLYRSDRLNTPMLLGLVRPVVLLPEGECPEGEQSVMLRHELTHLRRHDVAYKLFLELVCLIHWFNPLVWWMSREAGRNVELCCDEDVVRGRDKDFRRAYGAILLRTAAGAGRSPALSARMGGGKGHLKVRLRNLFVQKKRGPALVCVVLAAAILSGSLVSCTEEMPEETQGEDWAASATNFRDLSEAQNNLDDWMLILSSFDEPGNFWTDKQAAEAAKKQVEEHVHKLKNLCSILELETSVVVTRSGMVSFVIPNTGQTNDEWQIEIKGRAEVDGLGGMSLHYGPNRVELVPGARCDFNLSEEWSGVTELYLSVTLGEQSKDIDLLTIVPPAVPSGTIEAEKWMDGLSERWYVWDKDGVGGDFYIQLCADGSFVYYEGMRSSYIGMGTWLYDGKTLCLADEGMQDKINYYFFTVEEDALVFQAANSAQFVYTDVADGDRFSSRPIKPAVYDPAGEQ